MNMQLRTPENNAQPASIPIYHYGELDRITIDGKKHFTLVSQTTEGKVLKNEDGIHERFTNEQIYLLKAERRIKVERDYHNKEQAQLALKFGGLTISDFADHKVKKALWLEELIKEYIRFEHIGKKHPVLKNAGFTQRKVTLGYKCLTILLPILKPIIVERWAQANGGQETSYKLPCPRHFKRLHDLYIQSNCDPLSLVSLKTGPQSRSVFNPDDLNLWLEYVEEYCNEKRPSMRACRLRLQAEIAHRNIERSSLGLRLFKVPSRKCFENLIKAKGKYYLMAAQFGEEFARRKFAIVHGGLAIERPGQIVEMDCWKVNLSVLLTKLQIWQMLNEKERAAVQRTRLWITAAIDRATKCILALHFSQSAPSHRSSLAALEMVVSDKTLISSLVGAGDPWEYGLVPETISTDAGSEFLDIRFRTAVAALGCTLSNPPSGKPAARGTIESFFSTCEKRFMDYFHGRTFSNILDKRNYDTQGNAVLNIGEFNRLFTRAIIDIYHNTPHWGLGGETPSSAWRRLSADCAILEPIDAVDRMKIFGVERIRTICDKGVPSLGIHYDHPHLQRMRFEQQAIPGSPAPKVTIRVSSLDLSSICFKIGNDWVEAKATSGIPYNTTLYEWVAARADWLAQHGANHQAKLSTMLEAVRATRAAGLAAELTSGLGVERLTPASYDKIEKEYFKSSIIDDTVGGAEGLAQMLIKHNPLQDGIEVFDHIFDEQRQALAKLETKAEASEPSPKEVSHFGADDSDDDIDFDD
ncbi:integrase [uncultured Agrobacterium sp.]|uniref:integrase n=1 Tax=uncultured Agrobacterium sp. TaxID=157277 RepID=UPI0025EF4CB2|nr:integrase [uncultured Agrobacterium sp.]